MIIPVHKIYSYQTLVYKNGKNTYKKQVYKDYQKELALYMNRLPKYTGDLEVKIKFHCKNRTVGDLDNITKPILDTLQACGVIKDDRYILHLSLTKTFGSKANMVEIEINEIKGEMKNEKRN